MSQSAKPAPPQAPNQFAPRHGWPRAARENILGQAVPAFVRAGFSDATLILRWPEIAGPEVARIARPARWQEGPEGAVLTLKCEAGAAVLLQHQTRSLIERLNAYLGAGRIARLKLVSGRFYEVVEPPSHPSPALDSASDPADLAAALARLGRLRAALKAARLPGR